MLWICKNIWALWKYTSHSTRPQTSTENLVYFEKETDQMSAENICHLKWRRFQKMRGEVIILVNFPFSHLLKSSAHSVMSFPNDILHCTNLIFAFLTASPEWWSSSVGDIIATLSLFSILRKFGSRNILHIVISLDMLRCMQWEKTFGVKHSCDI